MVNFSVVVSRACLVARVGEVEFRFLREKSWEELKLELLTRTPI